MELCETKGSSCYLLPKVVAAGELVPTLSLSQHMQEPQGILQDIIILIIREYF